MASHVKMHGFLRGRISRFQRLQSLRLISNSQFRYQTTVANETENTDSLYPPVKPRWPPGKWDKKLPETACWRLHDQAEELKAIPAVKERLEKMSDEQRVHKIKPWLRYTGLLQYAQSNTRTHIANGMPQIYDDIVVDPQVFQTVKSNVAATILQERENVSRKEQRTKPELGRLVLGQIIRSILSSLSADNEYLLKSQLDKNVMVKSFWKRYHPANKKAERENTALLLLQYRHTADFQIRTELPLPHFLPLDDSLCLTGDYPDLPYKPIIFADHAALERPTSISGHWVGDPCEFGHISCHVAPDYLDLDLHASVQEFDKEAWTRAGLLTSFGWCVAQAYNQGFNWLSDVTYPYCTQTLLTSDCREIQLFSYQLNTMRIWQDHSANPLRNILWKSPKFELYDRIEGAQIRGLNEEALKLLLKFFLLEPKHPGVELRPYLTEEESPLEKKLYINHVGDEPLPQKKIGRFEYPRNSIYF